MTVKNKFGRIKASEIKKELKKWITFLYENEPSFASGIDFTQEKPSLLTVLITLKLIGYEIEYE